MKNELAEIGWTTIIVAIIGVLIMLFNNEIVGGLITTASVLSGTIWLIYTTLKVDYQQKKLQDRKDQ